MNADDIRRLVADSVALKQRFFAASAPLLLEVGGRMAESLRAGGRVLAFGNGGSAADAQHFVAELVGRFARERPGLSAVALTTDPDYRAEVREDLARYAGLGVVFEDEDAEAGFVRGQRPRRTRARLQRCGYFPAMRSEALVLAVARGRTAVAIVTELPLEALGMALGMRQPEQGLVHHSDRGCQYASDAYRSELAARGIVCSMSRVGDCWDNAVAESFFATLKTELIHRRPWPSKREAKAAIHDYIAAFYNPHRRHSSLAYLSPMDYERLHAAGTVAA